MEPRLIDELKGGIPALVALVPAIALIRFVCGQLGLRRLRLALCLVALAVSLLVFRRIAPTVAQPYAPYIWVITTFAGLYSVFKLAEVLLLDVFWRRAGRPQPPGIFRDVIAALVASVLFVLLLQVGLDVHVTTLVITSAALSIFLGLALQQTVSDVFAGVALVLERPFAPGDWVRIGDRTGRVEEISWRAVRIRLLRLDDYLIMPNSVIAKADIVNMSSPTRLHGTTVEVGVTYDQPPNRVRDIMVAAALEVDGVLAKPAPVAEVLRFDASAITYRLTFWVDDLPRSIEIESSVRAHVWYAFRRTDVEMPYPAQRTFTQPLAEARAADGAGRRARVRALLGRVDFLAVLEPAQIESLGESAGIVLYPAGATIFRRGSPGDSLLVVASGSIEVLDEPPGGGPLRPVGRRAAGDYIGEMSLLGDAPYAVEARAGEDVEVVVLTRDVMRPILVADPAVAERLSEALTRHRAGTREGRERLAESAPATEYHVNTVLSNIRRVFGLASAPP